MIQDAAKFGVSALFEAEDLQREALKEARNRIYEKREYLATLQEMAAGLKSAIEQTRSSDKGRELSLRLGAALWVLGRFREAIEPLEPVKTRKEACYLLGDCYEKVGRLDEAEDCFKKASRGNQDDFDISIKLINIKRQRGDAAKAIDDLEKLAKSDRNEPEMHFLLGRCLEDIGEYESAMNSYERAIELDPHFAPAAHQLAYALDLRGNDDEAIKWYEVCRQMPYKHANALINLGVLYEDRGEYRKAIACYEEVLERHPTHARARLFRADAQSSLTMYYDEEKEKIADRQSAVLDIPVTDFELSVRSRNCLEKMNIRTIGDLTRITEQQLLSYKNFGETSLNEIKQMLASRGLKLGQALEDGGPAFTLPMEVEDEEEEEEPQGLPRPGSMSAEELLSRPVGDLQLSVRGRRAMDLLGVKTVGDLIDKSEEDLLNCRNFGQTSINEVKEKLRAYGLRLKDDQS